MTTKEEYEMFRKQVQTIEKSDIDPEMKSILITTIGYYFFGVNLITERLKSLKS